MFGSRISVSTKEPYSPAFISLDIEKSLIFFSDFISANNFSRSTTMSDGVLHTSRTLTKTRESLISWA
jgi:hypothetical protein